MSTLYLSPEIYAQIRAHGEQTYPDECCGALLGHALPEGWRVSAAVPVGNACAAADAAHRRYRISPPDLARIAQEALLQNLEIAGFYHSHPDCPAEWSQTDLDEAHWIGCSFVITSVEQGRAAATRSFRLTGSSEQDKRFDLETIQLDENPGN